MNTNHQSQRALAENCPDSGPVPVNRKSLRERAVSLAANDGRAPQDAGKADWENARRELTPDSKSGPQPTPLEDHSMLGMAMAEREKLKQLSTELPVISPLSKLISEQPFFHGLLPAHLKILTSCAMEMDFEPGQYIMESGAPANRFYLILEGSVIVEAELPGHGMLPIETLGKGDNLGWSWLFPPYYMHSGARVVEQTKTIFFYGTRLRDHCEQDRELGFEMMRRVAEVVVRRLNATQKQLLECTERHKQHLAATALHGGDKNG